MQAEGGKDKKLQGRNARKSADLTSHRYSCGWLLAVDLQVDASGSAVIHCAGSTMNCKAAKPRHALDSVTVQEHLGCLWGFMVNIFHGVLWFYMGFPGFLYKLSTFLLTHSSACCSWAINLQACA